MYKLNENSITRLSDGAFIPFANGNTDYEEYKKWLADGNTPQPQYTDAELLAKETAEKNALAFKAKEEALNSITVTISSGKVFDGRDKDIVRMMAAIQASEFIGGTTTFWKMADNSISEITLNELKEAQSLAIQEIGRVIL